MLETSTASPGGALRPDSQLQSLWRTVWRRFCRHRLALCGMMILVILTLGTLFGPLVYHHRINDINFAVALQGPTPTHPLGTDDMGQDLLARLLYGGRVSIAVGLTSMLIAILLGTLIGALAGYCGGGVDNVLMRLTDLFISLPQLPLLLLVVYLFRDPMRRLFNPEFGIFLLMVIVIGGLRWMQPARLVRAAFLSLKEQEFVEAAVALGTSPLRLAVRHMLPNALSPVIVAASLGVGSAILTESSLSFLGLGFPPDMPTWGRLLFDAKDYLDIAPHWALFPGTMIFLVVLCINYVGDGLRDALDTRKVL
ncbi:MAG TPA: ABC transporter permease [Candidatus Tectomicrobia bacterium]|jgi:peptide/nickel transport system permease protein